MGLLDKFKANANKRKADRETKRTRWENPAQPTASTPATPEKRNGSGPNKNGDDKHSTKPEVKREQQTPISLEKKGLKQETTKTPELKKQGPKPEARKETASEFRARRAKELQAAKDKQSAKQKEVQTTKDAKWAKVAEDKAKNDKPKAKTNTGQKSSGVKNTKKSDSAGVKVDYTDNEVKELNRNAKPDKYGLTMRYEKDKNGKNVKKYGSQDSKKSQASLKAAWTKKMGSDAVYPGHTKARNLLD